LPSLTLFGCFLLGRFFFGAVIIQLNGIRDFIIVFAVILRIEESRMERNTLAGDRHGETAVYHLLLLVFYFSKSMLLPLFWYWRSLTGHT
jgi:hypothetical protein